MNLLASCLLASLDLPQTIFIGKVRCIEISRPSFKDDENPKNGVYRKVEFDNDQDIYFVRQNDRYFKSIEGDISFGKSFLSNGRHYTVGEHTGNGWYRIYDVYGAITEVSSKMILQRNIPRVPEKYIIGGEIVTALSNGIILNGKRISGEPSELIESLADAYDSEVLHSDGVPVI
jgi:hypothetical protein